MIAEQNKLLLIFFLFVDLPLIPKKTILSAISGTVPLCSAFMVG